MLESRGEYDGDRIHARARALAAAIAREELREVDGYSDEERLLMSKHSETNLDRVRGTMARATTSDRASFWQRVELSVSAGTENREEWLEGGTVIAMRGRSGGWLAARDARGRATRANDGPVEPEGRNGALEFRAEMGGEGSDADGLRLTARDASTQLVVLRFGKWYGFRSHAAGGRLLQARRRAGSEVAFYNFNFGICEQWELVDTYRDAASSGRAMMFRNRRFEHVTLDVFVSKVPTEFLPKYALDDMSLYDDDMEYVEYGTPGSDIDSATSPERRARDKPVPQKPLAAPPSPAETEKAPPANETLVKTRRTKTNAKPAEMAPGMLSAASLALGEKWSQMFQGEVELRKGLERELAEVAQELSAVKMNTHEVVQELQSEIASMSAQTVKTIETVRQTMTTQHIEVIESMQQSFMEELRYTIETVQDKASGVIVRTSLRALRAKAFMAWKEFASNAHKRRVAVVRYLLKSDRYHLRVAFSAWKLETQRAISTRRKGIIIRTRHIEKLARICFYRWVECAMETRQTRVIAARAHRRGVRDKSLELRRKTFFAWYAETKHLKIISGIQRQAVMKMRRRLLYEAFDSWKAHVQASKMFTQRLMKTFMRWEHRIESSVFFKWRDITERSRERRALQTKTLAIAQRVELYRAFHGWRAKATKLKSQRVALSVAVRRWRERLLARAWSAWKDYAIDGNRMSSTSVNLTALQKFSDKERKRRCWVLWRNAWRRSSAEFKELVTKIRFAQLNRYFAKWKSVIRTKERLRQSVTAKRVVHDTFLDWYWDTFGAEFEEWIQNASRQFHVTPDSPAAEAFHTPVFSPGERMWSPTKPKRLTMG